MGRPVPTDGSAAPGSFRDPTSRVVLHDGEVRRLLTENGKRDWEALAASDLFREWSADGRLIGTREAENGDGSVLVHEWIPFWSYPYEWSFSMLRSAAQLHLDVLDAALAEGLILKDATPYNVQFRGCWPVFVDIGSFRRYTPGEPWLGYGQFCRLFLYPLLFRAHAAIPAQPLLRAAPDGITPAHARSVLRGRRVFRPGVLADVVLHARAERSDSLRGRDVRGELSRAGFSPDMIRANVRRLRNVVTRTEWRETTSTWSDYAGCDHVVAQRAAKEVFVRRVVARRRRRLVWDLGTNDGHFARLAAENAESVVAVDADELVIDRLFRSLDQSGPGNVLPLVMNLTDHSPSWGWRGRERLSFEQRGRPDLVLFLAVVHHLVVSGNLPLAEVIDWLGSLGAEVVFEWVPPDDPMTAVLMANKRRGEVHPDYHESRLRELLEGRFAIGEEVDLGGRRLFHLEPRR